MKIFRYLAVIFTISIIMMMQACGSGKSSGFGADTSGTLTMTKTIDDSQKTNGLFLVSTTVTYTPPAGKTVQGLEVDMIATDGSGALVFAENDIPFTGSNSFTRSFLVQNISDASNFVTIAASIGGMKASVLAFIPGFTFPTLAVADPTVNFALAAPAGVTVDVPFTGGKSLFAAVSSVPADITADITADNSPSLSGGGILTIKLKNADLGGVASTAIVTLTDSNGGSVPITVNYFK